MTIDGLVSTVSDPLTTYKLLVDISIKKATLRLDKMIVMAIMAGFYVGLGGQLSASVLADCGGTGPCRYLGGLSFSTGLMIVVGAGAELFTGNCLLLIAVLARRLSPVQMLRDWGVVWTSNLVGSILVASIFYGGGVNGKHDQLTSAGEAMCGICAGKTGLGIDATEMFSRGIMANVFVCLTMIMATAAKSMVGKIFACLFPIAAFVTIGLEHSIANQSYFSACTMLRCAGIRHGDYWANLALSTIGNVLGASLLAVVYWWSYVHDSEAQFHSPLLRGDAAASPPGRLLVQDGVVAFQSNGGEVTAVSEIGKEPFDNDRPE